MIILKDLKLRFLKVKAKLSRPLYAILVVTSMKIINIIGYKQIRKISIKLISLINNIRIAILYGS